MSRGYPVTLLSDAIGSASDGRRDKAMNKLRRAGALIADTRSYLERLGY
ncbi:hypothetical protein [Gordoniibacillus kamchatkensis]|nr:hypothetical protein [Paenibacillus sp. VKM B-2647]